MMRHVLITGASRGIGKAIAFAFSREGWHVTGTYRHEESYASAVADAIRHEGGSIEFKKLDVTSLSNIKKLLKEISVPDALINNAGITRDSLFLSLTENEWKNVIDTNLTGIKNMCNEFSELMCQRNSGVIINIGSSSAFSARVGQTNYSASKCGLTAYTQKLAEKIVKYNVYALVVAPGYTETDMVSIVPNTTVDNALQRIPLKRWGSAEEIANVVLFAAKKEASAFIGRTLLVDGGRTAYESEFGN